ncbi:class I SAM-dependent methyltransferase [Candidatus Solirubrobacter pratensis]|uniref:class I SAM-dependent methyltransferase n=1 Tax=Candidatus Solirubrobacter pratensis TaxID=1298857 RepID=UPI0003F6EDD9|nr:class I SAM-dependent methyltransferase [Candidatus Solirubrobacter pratensis]
MNPSVITHGDRPFANPLSEAAIAEAIAALELPLHARALDIGCGTGELLARVPGVHRVGIEPDPERAAKARERLDEVHEARFEEVTLEPGSFDLVCCVGSSHAIGRWNDALRVLADLARPLAYALVGEGFWARPPSRGYLAALGATADELPDWDHLEAGAIDAGWALVRHAISSREDWAEYEETLAANGERAYAERPDPQLRAWLDASSARWNHPDGRNTLGFALLVLRRG